MMTGATRYLALIALTPTMLILAACSTNSSQHKQSLAPAVYSQLDALQAPQGADPAVFALLKDELARQLAQRGKAVSAPPTGTANTPANLYFTDEGGGNYALHWEYRNIGDYDQNGIVGVADITPIAMHFGHNGADGLDDVIDVDDNGVGVSDITPIAQNFGVVLNQYETQWAVSETGPTWTSIAAIPLASGTGKDVGWMKFSHTYAFDPANWYRVTPYDAEANAGQSSPAIQVGGGTINPPVITGVSPLSGETGENVTFTVTYTGDLPISFGWLFGGGATPNTSDDYSPTVTLGAVNDYSASVTLTNAAGSDTYDFNLNVVPSGAGWQIHNVVDRANVGSYISFAFIDGLPAFAYVDTNDGTLHYVRSTVANPAFSTDWVDMKVDETAGRWYDGEVSLIVDNYLTPIILAWEQSSSATMYIGSNIITPNSSADWEASEVAQPTDMAGALTLAQGSVFATYKDMGGMYFAEAVSYPPTGPADWSVITANPTAGAGSNSRMRYNDEDGRFYVTAYNAIQGQLYLSHCLFDDRAVPASWITFNLYEGFSGNVGAYSEFAFDPAAGSDNLFFIFYHDSGITSTPMAVLGFDGTADNSSFFFNSLEYSPGNYPGKFCSTAFGDQRVAVSYQAADPTSLAFMYSPFVTGEEPMGWIPQTVTDISASPLTDTNVLVYNGNIAEIVYGREDGIYFASLVMP